MRLICGVAGHARSGKDTIADWARHRGAHVDSFASPIKNMVCVGFGLTAEAFIDPALKEAVIPRYGKSPREFAQLLGTEFGRAINPDIWVLALEERISRPSLAGRAVFIPDVRFENEAAWIRGQGGIIVHVRRPGADGKVGVANHASEAGVGFQAGDLLIDNNESIEALHAKLEHIFPRSGFGLGDSAVFGNLSVTQTAPAVAG